MLTEKQVARLPAAVRDEIERLRKSVVYWQEQAHAASGGDGARTDTTVQDAIVGSRGLPPGTTIRFYLSPSAKTPADRRFIDAQIEYDHGISKGRGAATGVKIRGWGRVRILPDAANTVTIEPEN